MPISRRSIRNGSWIVGAVAGYYVYKENVGCNYMGKEDLKGNVFILTGATHPGIGKETARVLAKQGATVILAAKNMDRCHQARQDLIQSTEYRSREVECSVLDLKSMKSIRKFVDELPKDLNLRAVINTAESAKKTHREVTHDGLEKQMGVSHFGRFLLNNLLYEKYKNTGKYWRILATTDGPSGLAPMNFDDINSLQKYDAETVHKQTKLATLLMTRELSKRLEQTPSVTTNAVDPGSCSTDSFRHTAGNQPFFIRILLQPLMAYLFPSPEKACQTVLYAALSPHLVNVSGNYITACRPLNLPMDPAINDAAARQLWELSEKVVADPAKFSASETARHAK